MKGRRVLVCGGRDYRNFARLADELGKLHLQDEITLLIEGGANGADYMAKRWAYTWGIPTMTFPADFRKFGKRAGPIRNAQMIRDGRPDLVVAFPGGYGTADMVAQARRAGVPVIQIPL